MRELGPGAAVDLPLRFVAVAPGAQALGGVHVADARDGRPCGALADAPIFVEG